MIRNIALSFATISLSFLGCSTESTLPPGGRDAALAADTVVVPDARTNVDVSVGSDVPADGGSTFTRPTPFAVSLSAAGPDQLQSAAPGPSGTFYAAGFAAQTLAGQKAVTVVKFSPTGPPDTTFGNRGVATTTVISAGGTSDEIDIAVQPSGKLIVTSTVANAADSNDRDVAVFRLDGTTGALDTTFGVGGVRILDLSTALDASVAGQRDVSRGLAIGPTGLIYLHARQRNPGATASDSDFVVIRLTADGAVDTTYGTALSGKHILDIRAPADTAGSNATPRGIHVFADGSVIAGGYATSSVVGNTVQPVLYKLTPAGVLDTNFAEGGLFHDDVLTIQTEIYNFAVHGNTLVTGGYGRNAGTLNDWISLRFNVIDGMRDLTWGTSGIAFFDPSGAMTGSNCHNAIALPGGFTLLVGAIGPGNMPAQDAAFAVLNPSGQLSTAYGTGTHTFALGANQNDQFWGAAVSGNNALIVGYQGGGATPSETVNDDSYGVILPLVPTT